MSDDLDEILGRLNETKKDLDEYIKSVDQFGEENISRPIKEMLDGTFDLFVKLEAEFPKALLRKSGLIAYETRSCLDALANVLAERNNDPSGNSSFPIASSKDTFQNSEYRKRIKSISDADKSTIASKEPYFGGRNSSLFFLNLYAAFSDHVRLVPCIEKADITISGIGVENIIMGTFNGVKVRSVFEAKLVLGKTFKIAAGVTPYGADVRLLPKYLIKPPVGIKKRFEPLSNLDHVQLLQAGLNSTFSIVEAFR